MFLITGDIFSTQLSYYSETDSTSLLLCQESVLERSVQDIWQPEETQQISKTTITLTISAILLFMSFGC